MSNPYEQYPQPQYPSGGPPNPYGAQPYGVAPPEHPQGTTVLILGILGFVVGVTAPFAWYMGSKALKEIRASGMTYANESQITIGRILGMIITLLYVVLIVVSLAFAVFFLVAADAAFQAR